MLLHIIFVIIYAAAVYALHVILKDQGYGGVPGLDELLRRLGDKPKTPPSQGTETPFLAGPSLIPYSRLSEAEPRCETRRGRPSMVNSAETATSSLVFDKTFDPKETRDQSEEMKDKVAKEIRPLETEKREGITIPVRHESALNDSAPVKAPEAICISNALVKAPVAISMTHSTEKAPEGVSSSHLRDKTPDAVSGASSDLGPVNEKELGLEEMKESMGEFKNKKSDLLKMHHTHHKRHREKPTSDKLPESLGLSRERPRHRHTKHRNKHS